MRKICKWWCRTEYFTWWKYSIPFIFLRNYTANFLVVVQVKNNLLSVSQFTNNDSYTSEFPLHIQDKWTRDRMNVSSRSRRRDLYSLDLSNSTALFANSSEKASEELWHARLGHPQTKILCNLHKNSLLMYTLG